MLQSALKRYAQLKMEMLEIQDELRIIEESLKKEVGESDQISAFGFKAQWKPGRKRTDHLAAARDAKVPAKLIHKHTTMRPSISWAKITKEAGIDLDEYTDQSPPTFVIEPDF